jgi:hypothetical protein
MLVFVKSNSQLLDPPDLTIEEHDPSNVIHTNSSSIPHPPIYVVSSSDASDSSNEYESSDGSCSEEDEDGNEVPRWSTRKCDFMEE